jgi:tRNA pseudouridine38-40 synthase
MVDPELVAATLQTWKLTLSYDGTDYRGWQVQPGEPTVQGELQGALGRVTGESPLPQGSGRSRQTICIAR